MSKAIAIDELDSAINDILEDYGDSIKESIDDATSDVGKAGAIALRQKSKETFKGNHYYRGWKCTIQHHILGKSVAAVAIIHNTDYRLPHLLENGHANRDGSRTSGRPHISTVEDEINNKFFKKVKESIKRTRLSR